MQQILTCEKLEPDHLEKLINDEMCILHIPNYFQGKGLSKLKKHIVKSRNDYVQANYVGYKDQKIIRRYFGVNVLGTAYNTTYNKQPDDPEFATYFQNALTGIRSLRQAIAPYQSPIDQLRLELDENWIKGARIGSFNPDKKMFVGTCRIVLAKESHLGEIQPHIDSLPQNIHSLKKQFSANIYIHVPESGGELEVWDLPPLSPEAVTQLDIDHTMRNTHPNGILFKPSEGDLALFNTRRPHAVKSFSKGIRSSIQCFIGLNKDGSLTYWS